MDISHGKYLAVDYGDVRTGLADCDPSGPIASGIGTVSPGGMRNTAVLVAEEARKRGCRRIIVGLPKNMDGSEGPRADVIKAFVAILSELTELPIDLADERMTTMAAYRFLDGSGTYGKKRKGVIDTLSAQIILQDYLDSERASRR